MDLCPVCDEPLHKRPKDNYFPADTYAEDDYDKECRKNGCYEELFHEEGSWYESRLRVGTKWFWWDNRDLPDHYSRKKQKRPQSKIDKEITRLREKRNKVSSEQRAFLQAIQENPRDQTTRLVYADWLEENGLDDTAHEQRRWCSALEDARDRLKKFSEDVGISYETCIQAGYDYVNHGDYFTQQGREDARDAMNKEVSKQWWEDWCLITGENKPEEPEYGLGSAPFSCSC